MDETMVAMVTTYGPSTFHKDLCVLLGWKTPPSLGAYRYMHGYHNYSCGHCPLEINLVKYSSYAFPEGKPTCRGSENYYRYSWGCKTHGPPVKEKIGVKTFSLGGRDTNLADRC